MLTRASSSESESPIQRFRAAFQSCRRYRIGLVSEVLAPPALMEAAERYADAIIRNGPLGVRSAKESMIRGLGRTLEDAMRLENILFSTLTRTDDFKEGPRAFTEKREPVWKGR